MTSSHSCRHSPPYIHSITHTRPHTHTHTLTQDCLCTGKLTAKYPICDVTTSGILHLPAIFTVWLSLYPVSCAQLPVLHITGRPIAGMSLLHTDLLKGQVRNNFLKSCSKRRFICDALSYGELTAGSLFFWWQWNLPLAVLLAGDFRSSGMKILVPPGYCINRRLMCWRSIIPPTHR